MANFAALIDTLSISGSRLTDGTANASGKVYFFQPGTNTTVQVYSDAAATTVVTQPITLGAGGKLPSNLSGGVFATQPVRILIQTSDGATTVTDNTWIPATAGDVGMDNDGWTATVEDEAWTALYTSVGGVDGQYLESGGATERTIKSKFSEIWISVKDFGAVGDGNATDTTAIQAAMNRVKALGGGVVYFPPGTYKIDAALTLSSATGVRFLGAGPAATTIISNHATANAFTLTSCATVSFAGIQVSHATASTGAAFRLTSCLRPVFERVIAGESGTYRYGAYLDTCLGPSFFACSIFADPADAAGRGLFATACTLITTVGGTIQGVTGYAVELDGSSAINAYGTALGLTVRFAATSTAGACTFVSTSLTSISLATATIPYIRHLNSGIDASATSSATGAAQTPVLYSGKEVILTAASGGAGIVTVNPPAILPGTGASNGVDWYWDFVFKNAAGGAVTWTLDAIYVVTAAIPTTDGHTIMVRFRWDRTTSELRECSRADTVT